MHSSGATSGEVIADQRFIKMAERGEQATHSNGANSIQSFLGGPQKSSTSRSEERRGTTKSVRFASEICVISLSLNDPPLEIRGQAEELAASFPHMQPLSDPPTPTAPYVFQFVLQEDEDASREGKLSEPGL
jgi:hypothetical protein